MDGGGQRQIAHAYSARSAELEAVRSELRRLQKEMRAREAWIDREQDRIEWCRIAGPVASLLATLLLAHGSMACNANLLIGSGVSFVLSGTFSLLTSLATCTLNSRRPELVQLEAETHSCQSRIFVLVQQLAQLETCLL